MTWWTTIVDSARAVGNKVGEGVTWVVNNASITGAATATVTYASNTIFQLASQFSALQHAVPSIIKSPKSRQVLNSMLYIAINDVMPLVALNYANQTLQSYNNNNEENNNSNLAWYSAYSLFCKGLTLIDWGVRTYTIRQGVQSVIRIGTLDVIAPHILYNELPIDKNIPKYNLCLEEQCDIKRRIKGNLREPFILAANELLAAGVEKIPYVGPVTSKALHIFFNGRYIARTATPDLCERHKFQSIMQESTLALGISYEMLIYVVDSFLAKTFGIPDFITHRTLRHLFLLSFANLAMHMKLPIIKPEQATLPFDVLNMYEGSLRFIADVACSGLMARIPIDFKMDPDAMPLIPINTALQFGTSLFDNDIERENEVAPSMKSKILHGIKFVVLPPMLHSTQGFINDPVIAKFWPTLQETAVTTAKLIQRVVESKTVGVAAYFHAPIAITFYVFVGIPENVTNNVLLLTKEEDLKKFITALKGWLERHHVWQERDIVTTITSVGLAEDRDLIPLPEISGPTTILIAAEDLTPTRQNQRTVVHVDNLIPVRVEGVVKVSANSLFTTRKRNNVKTLKVEETPRVEEVIEEDEVQLKVG